MGHGMDVSLSLSGADDVDSDLFFGENTSGGNGGPRINPTQMLSELNDTQYQAMLEEIKQNIANKNKKSLQECKKRRRRRLLNIL
jgi:hypothetical protein